MTNTLETVVPSLYLVTCGLSIVIARSWRIHIGRGAPPGVTSHYIVGALFRPSTRYLFHPYLVTGPYLSIVDSLPSNSLESGSTAVAKLNTVFPSGAIKYLWKFHCGAWPVAVRSCR